MSQSGRVELLKKNQTQRPEQRLDIYVKARRVNMLPDIPVDYKFFHLPYGRLSKHAEHSLTDLERKYTYELAVERDLDIGIDLVNTARYDAGEEVSEENWETRVDPAELYLLEDEASNSKRSKHNDVVPWMRKTQYISQQNVRYGVGAERQETKIGYKLLKSGEAEHLYRDREAQIEAINKTFDDVKKPILKHPTKSGVRPIEEIEVLPDFENWHLPVAQVVFDSDPIPYRKSGNKEELMERAFIRGMTNADGTQQFVAYFAPTDECLEHQKLIEQTAPKPGEDNPFSEGEKLEYKLGREYNWSVRNESTKGYVPSYYLTFKDGFAFYNSLDSKVKLSRKPKGGVADTLFISPDAINDAERVAFVSRLDRLKQPEVVDEAEIDEAGLAEIEENVEKTVNDIFGDGDEDDENSSDSSSSSSDDSESDASNES